MGRARLDPERAGFDKWQMYKLIRGEEIGPCIVPKTSLLSMVTLRTYLNQYGRVYVKPTGTWGGSNISFVEEMDGSILWTCQDQGQEASLVDLNQVLLHYDGVPSIVQQAIPALRHDGCPFDIRVHMQRDLNDDWVYAGELVRVGGHGIVSNVGASHGSVWPMSTLVCTLFSMSDKEMESFRHQLVEIGTTIGGLFNDYSSIEEIGIDLALDSTRRFWLIEVNTNDAYGGPSHDLFRQLPDERVYQEIEQRAMSRKLNMLKLFFELLEDGIAEE